MNKCYKCKKEHEKLHKLNLLAISINLCTDCFKEVIENILRMCKKES